MASSSTDVTAGPYTTNGATTSFSFSFRVADYGGVEAEDMVKVILVTIATGAETVLTRGVSAGQYTVSVNGDQDSSPGGSITTISTYATGFYIYIRLKPTFTQATELTSQTGYNGATHEAQFDEQQRQILDLRDRIRRVAVPGVQIGESFDGEITGTPLAGAVAVLNEDLDGYEWAINDGSTTTVAATGSSESRTLANWIADAAICFSTYAEMTAATYLVDNAIYYTYARATEEDGGSGFWRYDAGSTATVDGGSILAIDGGGAGRFFRLHDGIARPEWFGSSSAWGAAITAAAVNFNIVRFTPGVTYSWSDSQVAIDKDNFVLDCRGATLRPTYASDYAFKFGTGSTQRLHNFVIGGIWNQRSISDGGAAQGLFDIRGIRQFYLRDCRGVNIYQLARWGNPADSQSCFKWYHENCDWDMRANSAGGHTHAILADGSAGGYYENGVFFGGDSANVSGTQAIFRLTSSQGPARFDHMYRTGGNWKGFDYGIHCVDARLVNVDWDPSARTDDTQIMGVYIEATSGASKGGCEDINLRGAFHGLGPGGALHVKDDKGGLGFTDIVLSEAHSNNATGTVVKLETSGSGAISNVHIDALHIANYVPSDANQDAIVLDGDIDEFSVNQVTLDGKSGASFLARRVVYDNTGSTKIGTIGPNIWGDVNTSVVDRTNAGTTAGRHNWMRTDGTPVGAWVSATDKILGRVSASAGPVEEVTFTDQAQALCDDTSFRAMCATLGAWHCIAKGGALSHTGDTSSHTFASGNITGGSMGANGSVRIVSFWRGTNSGNNKTMQHKFGGTNYFSQNFTTQLTWRHESEITNQNATNSQLGNGNNSFGAMSQAANSSSHDTTADVSWSIVGTLANSGDTIELLSYRVEVLYAA